MDLADLNARMAVLFDDCLGLAWTKGEDKAGFGDAFSCLCFPRDVGICSVEEGLLVMISFKLKRLIQQLIHGDSKPNHESLADNCKDLINYTAFLKIWLDEDPVYSIPEEVIDLCMRCGDPATCEANSRHCPNLQERWAEEAAHRFLRDNGRLVALDNDVLEGLLRFEAAHATMSEMRECCTGACK